MQSNKYTNSKQYWKLEGMVLTIEMLKKKKKKNSRETSWKEGFVKHRKLHRQRDTEASSLEWMDGEWSFRQEGQGQILSRTNWHSAFSVSMLVYQTVPLCTEVSEKKNS
jgi:hypothetical protein